ncbi:hypothetical protein [Trujillonella endophytica]|uniref:Uncharacterized protein n=1 Tax=Trujillonella endophytica TaxID=673521 RepID=A0A1H8W576_9ACTN|nr:hypothetical protein [Trujillella endophytica]SEP22796.1 hypothetical protein SAMN05660991_04087 [Trujillella endophytica]
MYLFVFVGLAWLLTAPAMGVLIGKMISTADRRSSPESRFAGLEAELDRSALRPVAGSH